MTRLIIILLTAMISGCCSYEKKDFDFNFNELNHFSSFHPGDTIYYENNVRDIDTILILGFGTEQSKNCGGFLAPKPINGKWIEIKHLPVDKWSDSSQEIGNPIRIHYQKIFWISKHPTDKSVTIDLNFKDFYSTTDSVIGEFHSDTLYLNSLKIANYYKVKHSHPERLKDSTNIELVYWTVKDGLVAYKNKGGQTWTKKATTNNVLRENK